MNLFTVYNHTLYTVNKARQQASLNSTFYYVVRFLCGHSHCGELTCHKTAWQGERFQTRRWAINAPDHSERGSSSARAHLLHLKRWSTHDEAPIKWLSSKYRKLWELVAVVSGIEPLEWTKSNYKKGQGGWTPTRRVSQSLTRTVFFSKKKNANKNLKRPRSPN